MVILDTNIIIDHLRQKDKSTSWLRKLTEKVGAEKLGISMATIQELYVGKSVFDPQNEQMMLQTISSFEVESYSYEIAKMAGELVRNLNGQLQFADAAIAATAIVNGASLFTLNTKDFLEIKNLEIYKI